MKEHNITVAHVDNCFNGDYTVSHGESYFKDFIFNMKMMILEINIQINWVENDDKKGNDEEICLDNDDIRQINIHNKLKVNK